MNKLINCPMCNKEISPNATSCPNCGEPINSSNELNSVENIDIKPILEVSGQIFLYDQYRDGVLLICQNYVVVMNIDKTEVYVMLNYDTIKDLNYICKKPKKQGGFLKDISVKTFFNNLTHDELPEFKINNKTELKEFDKEFFKLMIEIKRNPMKYLNIKCPSCGSSTVKKIGDLSKASSLLLFGVFAMGKIGKTFECQNCQYKW